MLESPARSLTVYPDEEALADGAARVFLDSLEKAIREKDLFSVLLSGGTTPAKMYRLLSNEAGRKVAWDKVHFFWGDERSVPPESPESNFNTARENLLSKIAVPPGNIHRIKGELAPEKAAGLYEAELVSFFGLDPGEGPPFDLVLLGLGNDGHTLSLFPGTDALGENRRLVCPNYVPGLGAWRVTLTLKALEMARRAVFIVSGQGKAGALRDVLGKKDLPGARVRAKEVLWIVDAGAASSVEG